MTFIASVIAKKGVAIIADSLVTQSRPIIEFDAFLDFIKKKASGKDKEVKIEPKEIIDLFKVKPSHTKDYEEKLFQYDKYTAITTAGAASINNKKIEKIIADAIKKLKPNSPSNKKTFDQKLEELKNYLIAEIKLHLKSKTSIRPTVFIITNYSKNNAKTIIYKLEVNSSSKTDLKKENYEFLSMQKQPDHYTVVCDGQNRISERILFGDIDMVINLIPNVVRRVASDFKVPAEKITEAYLSGLLQDKGILTRQYIEDIKINKLTELSLQQAVDLACLLMRIEIDIQKYTENIPTVGGLIKLAIIDEGGFKFITGNEIVRPDNV